MAKVKSTSKMTFEVTLDLSEAEARGLEGITKYGSSAFLEVFYRQLGKSYLKPYEEGIISLFDTIRSQLPPHLSRIDDTRKTFQKKPE